MYTILDLHANKLVYKFSINLNIVQSYLKLIFIYVQLY